MAAEVSLQPPGVMGTYTYWHVACDKEKHFEIVRALIRGFKHYKIENVPKIGHLELMP